MHTHTTSTQQPSLHVLLVEDNPLVQKAHSIIVETLGHRIDIAETGQAAIMMCQTTETYDVILMDIGLPDMSGIDVTRALRQMNHLQSVPIIAITAHAPEEHADEYKQAGINRVLQKPITSKIVQQLLLEMCSQSVVE